MAILLGEKLPSGVQICLNESFATIYFKNVKSHQLLKDNPGLFLGVND